MGELKAPFPYFGGKASIADEVWRRFGNPPNYVEPFFGSGAILLMRPGEPGTETVNDACGMLCNFWRAVQHSPKEVAEWADWPANENDLHARHVWLVERKDSLQSRLEGDPDYYDAKAAGWWVWGMSLWIGSGFCSGNGAWRVCEVDGEKHLVKGDTGKGVQRQLLHLGDAGQGVQRPRLHLGDASTGVQRKSVNLEQWMADLSSRLRRVRVACGDWSRVCGPAITIRHGITAVFLDPPYSAEAGRDNDIYRVESGTVAHDVREWCLENGGNKFMRIALCGYEGEGHEVLENNGWQAWAWKSQGGYANLGNNKGKENARRERVWFSPHCLTELTLF